MNEGENGGTQPPESLQSDSLSPEGQEQHTEGSDAPTSQPGASPAMPERPDDGCKLPDHLRCTARSKQTGNRCRQHVRPGRRVCFYHGGASLRGIGHPNWKHGCYSADFGLFIRRALDRPPQE